MLKHVVCWKVKDEVEGMSKSEILQKMKSMLDVLPSKIDVIKSFEVGIDTLHTDRSFDITLHSGFENAEALKTYATHPDHMEVVEFFKKVTEKGVAVDYVM